MYLSEEACGQERVEGDHTTIEMLLDSYYRICNETVHSSDNLIGNVRNTEEM